MVVSWMGTYSVKVTVSVRVTTVVSWMGTYSVSVTVSVRVTVSITVTVSA